MVQPLSILVTSMEDQENFQISYKFSGKMANHVRYAQQK